ncbi:MAG: hypothetical protein QMC36_01425 [Patescibacteria group bacterium]
MAKPLDLEALGIPGNRNPVKVSETVGAVVPFTQGAADLEVGHSGAVAPAERPDEKPATQSRTETSDDAADKHFRSRIGRRFRSF